MFQRLRIFFRKMSFLGFFWRKTCLVLFATKSQLSLVHLIGKLPNFHVFRIISKFLLHWKFRISSIDTHAMHTNSLQWIRSFQIRKIFRKPWKPHLNRIHTLVQLMLHEFLSKMVCWQLKINSMVYHLLRARASGEKCFYANKFFKHWTGRPGNKATIKTAHSVLSPSFFVKTTFFRTFRYRQTIRFCCESL